MARICEILTDESDTALTSQKLDDITQRVIKILAEENLTYDIAQCVIKHISNTLKERSFVR